MKNFFTRNLGKPTLLLIMILGISPSSFGQGQVVKNWDFETELEGWGATGGTAEIVDTQAQTGTKSVSVTTLDTSGESFLENTTGLGVRNAKDVLKIRVYVDATSLAKINGIQFFVKRNGWSWDAKWNGAGDLVADSWNTLEYTLGDDVVSLESFGLQILTLATEDVVTVLADNITISSTEAEYWSFEDSALGPWGVSGGTSEFSTTAAFDGTVSLKVKSANASNETFVENASQAFPNVNGRDILKIRVWIDAENLAKINGIQFFVKQNGWSWNALWNGAGDMTADQWNTFTYVMGNDAVSLQSFGLQILTLAAEDEVELLVDYVSITDKTLEYEWDFEGGTMGDWAVETGTGELSQDQAFSKSNSIKVTTLASSGETFVQNQSQNFAYVNPADKLKMRVWIDADNLAKINGIQFFVKRNGWSWDALWNGGGDMTAGTWNEFTYKIGSDVTSLEAFGLQILTLAPEDMVTLYVDYVTVDGVAGVTDIVVSAASDATTITVDDGTLQMSAAVEPLDVENPDVIWSVENTEGEAFIDASTGLLTAYDNGAIKVVATAADGSGTVTKYDVLISNQVIAVDEIVVKSTGDVLAITVAGNTLQMFAAFTPDKNAMDRSLTWSVSPSGIATIDENGLLTAVDNGVVTVTAVSQDNASATSSLDITVKLLVTGLTVSATGNASTITTNAGKIQMTAAVTPTNAVDKTVFWRVENQTGKATIDSDGMLTAVKDGTVSVYAISNDVSETRSNKVPITISGQYVPVTSIAVWADAGANTVETLNGTLQMKATILPVTASIQGVIWTVVNGTGSASISETGLLTAESDGVVTVIATSTDSASVAPSEMRVTLSGQPLGVGDMEIFSIYPNPTSDQITIEGTSSTIDKLEIITVEGKVLRTVFDQNTVTIADLSKGVYFLKIYTSDDILINRVIKK